MYLLSLVIGLLLAPCASAENFPGVFSSIDGGTLSREAWRGRPALVANTASRCTLTQQSDELQAADNVYCSGGLIVLAVPSQDVRQELPAGEGVKDFCQLNFDLDLPMMDITSVRGPEPYPFFEALKVPAG